MNSLFGRELSFRIGLIAVSLSGFFLNAVAAAEAVPSPAPATTPLPKLEWLVLKPIPFAPSGGTAGDPDDAAQKKAFETDLLARQGSEAALEAKVGTRLTVSGVDLTWQKPDPPSNGMYHFGTTGAATRFAGAYAWTEFEFPAETKVLLGLGSDDHVSVWLNGKLVHRHWIKRGLRVDDDVVPLTVQAGKNHLLLKIQNSDGNWGFACRFLDQEMIANKLAMSARRGEIDTLQLLLAVGIDLNTSTSYGLNAYHAARLGGQPATVKFLVEHGADPKSPAPSAEKMVDTLLSHHIAPNEAGAAVLVARDGKILFEKGYGLADLEAKRAITPTTPFRIGSVTKQFTASAILKLAEQGKLELSDPLSKYYPDFPGGSEITLRHLLTHTSGLHSYTAQPDFSAGVAKPVSSAELITSIQKFPPDFAPGKKWAYCNSGYFLLGDIVEKVSGQSYDAFVRQTFFRPLEMATTGVYQNAAPPKDSALGYHYNQDHFDRAVDWDMTWAGGAGALYSTVEDLYRWNEAVFSGKVLSADNQRAAFTPVKTEENKELPSDDGYGYGWGISRFRGDREISHSGGLEGYMSFLMRLPDRHFTVAVVANSLPGKPGLELSSLTHDIAEMYLGSEFAVDPTPEAQPVSDAALTAIVGRYDAGRGIMEVTKKGSQVFVQLTGQPAFEIFPKSDTEFFLKVIKAEITFVKDATGKVTKAINHQNGMTLVWPRIESTPEATLDSAKLDVVVGEYDYSRGATLTVTREGGRLFAQLTGQPKFELFAKSETEFFWKVVAAELTIEKDAEGKVTKATHHQNGHSMEVKKIK